MSEPRAVSPLAGIAGLAHRAREVSLEEHALRGHLNLRGDAADQPLAAALQEHLGLALPQRANTVSRAGERLACWLGPDEWSLILEDETAAARLAQALESALAGCAHALNDLSSAQTLIRLRGQRAREVLAKGCTLDLHPPLFAPGQCAQTLLAKATVVLIPLADGSGFDIVVRRSFADYLYRWLMDACR